MKDKEACTQKGPGVEYKKNVSVRSDKISGHGDQSYSTTQGAFKSALNDTKKA